MYVQVNYNYRLDTFNLLVAQQPASLLVSLDVSVSMTALISLLTLHFSLT